MLSSSPVCCELNGRGEFADTVLRSSSSSCDIYTIAVRCICNKLVKRTLHIEFSTSGTLSSPEIASMSSISSEKLEDDCRQFIEITGYKGDHETYITICLPHYQGVDEFICPLK